MRDKPAPQQITGAALLTFEAEHPHPAGRDRLIRDTFGISRTRYYQLLIAYAGTEQALQQDPITVRRILNRATKSRTAGLR